MRKLFELAALIFLAASPSFASWAIVNQGLNCNSGTSGVACPLGFTTASGNVLIVVLVYESTTGDITSLVDNATGGSSTYATIGSGAKGVSTAAGTSSEIWCALVKTGATSITPTTSDATDIYAGYAYENSGISSCTPDATGNKTNATGTTGALNADATLTTSVSGDFIVDVNSPNEDAVTVSAGFTLDNNASGVGFSHLTSTSAASGMYTATWTDSVPSDPYEASDGAFKPSGAASCNGLTTLTELGVGCT